MFSHSLLFLYCTVPFSTNHTAHATVIRLNHECIQYTAETETSVQLLIEAGLSTETRQDQDEWMPALAHHAATDVYESTDDYYQIKFVRYANQHHWLHDCKTLAMTQRDLNYLPK